MKRIINENVLNKIIKKVLSETSWSDITKLGSEVAKKKMDDMIKNKSTTSSPLSTNKSTYDSKKDVMNKNLPEFTVTTSKPTIKGGSYVIDINNPKSKDFTLIWGGMPSSQYGAKFMREKGVGYLKNKNVIYSNYENSLNTLKDILKNNGVKDFRIKSVSGFSRGGINAWNELKGNYDFVGLIDPSTPLIYKSLPNKAKMISRWENWGCCPTYKRNIKTMEDSKVSQRIPSTSYNHLDMPEIFYKKFSNLM